jgi:hypothetical protein
MRRGGHASTKAALLYPHAAEHRDVELAQRMTALATKGARQSGRPHHPDLACDQLTLRRLTTRPADGHLMESSRRTCPSRDHDQP